MDSVSSSGCDSNATVAPPRATTASDSANGNRNTTQPQQQQQQRSPLRKLHEQKQPTQPPSTAPGIVTGIPGVASAEHARTSANEDITRSSIGSIESGANKRPKVDNNRNNDEGGDDDDGDGKGIATTTTTPARNASFFIAYPKDVPVPPRNVVRTLFEEAVAAKQKNEQQELIDAGLLSFQDVLLPSVAYMEDAALKQVQSVVQRDRPEYKPAVVACRKAVYDGIGAAMVAAEESRHNRGIANLERERMWQQRRELELEREREESEARQQEQVKWKEMARAKRKRELKKKLPRNQELWREIAYLMSELPKLEKEERMWIGAQSKLERQEADIAAQEEENAKQPTGQRNQMDLAAVEHQQDDIEEMARIERAIETVTLSSTRIRTALGIVSDAIDSSDKIRKELYYRYRQEYQFSGYQGVKDPKGLLRALSQSQDPVIG